MQHKRSSRQRFHFGMKDDGLFAFAGIWDRWKSATGQLLESCSILTTTPNELLVDVHDRMPVILPRRHYDACQATAWSPSTLDRSAPRAY